MSPAAIPSRVTSPARMSACNRDRLKSLSRRARKRSSRSPASSALTDTWKRLAVSCVVMILRLARAASSAGGPRVAPPSTLSSIDPHGAYYGADRPNAWLIPARRALAALLDGTLACRPSLTYRLGPFSGPVRLAVRTSASHVENRGSIPLRGASHISRNSLIYLS